MKNIVITGGTEGLGRGIAETFAAQKEWRVCILGRNAYKTAAIAQTLDVEHVVADVMSPEALQNAADYVRKHMGHLAVLVNNAGFQGDKPLEEMDPAAIKQTIDVNLLGPILTTQAFLPLLDPDSRIFHIGSYASRRPNKDYPIYTASKVGLAGFHEATAGELRKKGISSTLVTVGALDTGLQDAHGHKARQRGGLSARDVAEQLLHIADGPSSLSPEELVIHSVERWRE